MYCAANIALATLETVHSLRNGGLPFNRYLVRIDVPDAVWDARQVLGPLPGGWDAIPAGLSARTAGDAWVASRASTLLLVPSVLVPDECNVLSRAAHTDFGTVIPTKNALPIEILSPSVKQGPGSIGGHGPALPATSLAD